MFTDFYGQQSCTAERAAFITGQQPIRTGLTKVGIPGAKEGLSAEDPTIAQLLKNLATRQANSANHPGDRNEHMPTLHGFDQFFGNLYHLNAEEEPEPNAPSCSIPRKTSSRSCWKASKTSRRAPKPPASASTRSWTSSCRNAKGI
jgi:arylsulfatase A-like enzyme